MVLFVFTICRRRVLFTGYITCKSGKTEPSTTWSHQECGTVNTRGKHGHATQALPETLVSSESSLHILHERWRKEAFIKNHEKNMMIRFITQMWGRQVFEKEIFNLRLRTPKLPMFMAVVVIYSHVHLSRNNRFCHIRSRFAKKLWPAPRCHVVISDLGTDKI